MADDLYYGEGGLRFPRVDEARRELEVAGKSIWQPRTPWPLQQTAITNVEGETHISGHYQDQLPDGWAPEPPDSIGSTGTTIKLTVPDDYAPGKGTLTYPSENGKLISIPRLNLDIIKDRSPLLAAAFEGSQSGQRLYLDTLSQMTAMPLLRYLYSESYSEFGFWEDVPTSLLLHCRMYHLGMIYDIDGLKLQAKVNILRQCEFGCSSPDQPIDLCAAIRFAYDNLKDHEEAISTIIHYCVSCFLSHNLDKNPDFKQLAYDLRPFHQDLVKVCRDRNYDDESATAIIQMPYKSYKPETYASLEHPAIAKFQDLIFHFHGSDDTDSSSSKRKRQVKTEEPEFTAEKHAGIMDRPRPRSALTLALRQEANQSLSGEKSGPPAGQMLVKLPIRSRLAMKDESSGIGSDEEASASECEDLHIVRRRRLLTAPESPSRTLLSGSESEFECIYGPPDVESAGSDNDNNSDAAVLVDVPTASNGTLGELNSGSSSCNIVSQPLTTGSRADDPFSESEWEEI